MRLKFEVRGRTRQEVRDAARVRIATIEAGEGDNAIEWVQLHLSLRPETETFEGAPAMWIGTVYVSEEDVPVWVSDDLGAVMGYENGDD